MYVKRVIHRFHAASLIVETLTVVLGFSETDLTDCHLRILPDLDRKVFWLPQGVLSAYCAQVRKDTLKLHGSDQPFFVWL